MAGVVALLLLFHIFIDDDTAAAAAVSSKLFSCYSDVRDVACDIDDDNFSDRLIIA